MGDKGKKDKGKKEKQKRLNLHLGKNANRKKRKIIKNKKRN